MGREREMPSLKWLRQGPQHNNKAQTILSWNADEVYCVPLPLASPVRLSFSLSLKLQPPAWHLLSVHHSCALIILLKEVAILNYTTCRLWGFVLFFLFFNFVRVGVCVRVFFSVCILADSGILMFCQRQTIRFSSPAEVSAQLLPSW